MPRVREIASRARLAIRSVRDLTARERQIVLSEIVAVKGLMPLLMKPRNKQRWSAEDKAQLAAHLGRLSRITPYIAIFVMPGGFFILPAFAWWLDRRRNRAHAAPGDRT